MAEINPNASTQGDRVLDETRKEKDLRQYQRIQPSAKSRQALRERGMSWVLSSNVSAIGRSGDDLYVRFHNGSIYVYFNKGDLFQDMYKANSKGRFVWRKLRRPNVPYKKVGSMPLDEDLDVSDEEIMTTGISTQEPRNLSALALGAAAGIALLSNNTTDRQRNEIPLLK